MAGNAKALFRATKPKVQRLPGEVPLMDDLPEQLAHVREQDVRDALDFDPTPHYVTRAFLGREGDRLREITGPVWENAVGAGHIAMVLEEEGFQVVGTDVVHRGWPKTKVRDFREMGYRPWDAEIVVTNPPYNLINASQSGGWWLEHTMALGIRYAAFLLNWDWPAAKRNGMDRLLERYPFSRAYLCRFKIDFRGGGSPPQRNGWFVWDLDGPDPQGQRMLFLDDVDPRQGNMLTEEDGG